MGKKAVGIDAVHTRDPGALILIVDAAFLYRAISFNVEIGEITPLA